MRPHYPTKSFMAVLFAAIVVVTTITAFPAGVRASKDWTILASYTIPGKASGLAWDGTYLYFGIYGSNGDKVYKVDPSNGSYQLLFSNPSINDSYGMTHDGNHLWITDHTTSSSVPAYAMELDNSGNIVSQFNLPDHYMSGIAYDNGDFWVATYYPNPGTIYKVDATGSVIKQIPTPNEQPWDLCLQGSDLWVVDYNANMIYKTDQNGTVLESHACENMKPAGIVYDGQYLWYVDGQLSSDSKLYKVDLGGAGTPQINVPLTYHDYGNIPVGDSAIWNCTVNSTGTAPLVITNFIFPSAVPIFVDMALPQTVEPGNSIQIPIKYKPTEPGQLNTVFTIESNDPITPQVDLSLTGDAVYVGPHIQIAEASHNYGSVRLNAHTRWFMNVQNNGSQPLIISSINFSNPDFYLDWTVNLPLQINVLATAEIGIWFNPSAAAAINGTVTIQHNDISQNPSTVSLSGTGNGQDYPIGDPFWNFTISGSAYDNSPKAISPMPDVTGDGIDDVIICSEDDYIRCFNGNASGIGDVIWENGSGSVYGQTGLAIIEDIDNDGYQDVIVGLAWGVKSVHAISGYDGTIIWTYDTHIFGQGGWIYQVYAGYDYNNDGISDVLASSGDDSYGTGPKRFHCLDGLTGTPIWNTFTGGPNFSVIGVEDFNFDNIPDVIGGSSNDPETQGYIYGLNGATGAILWNIPTGGTSVWALGQLDDITNDGVKDIVAGDFGGNYYLVNPVTGAAVFTGSVGPALILRCEIFDDVNGDGYKDFSLAKSNSSAVMISGYTGQNIWLQSLADKVWNIDRMGDITGDGINDMVAGTLYSSNYVYFLNGVDGAILHSVNFYEAVDAIGAIPDINGDGSWEMVAGGRNGKVYCYSGGLNASVPNIELDITVIFEGPYEGPEMTTFLNTLGYIPLSQPFNTVPWNYTGTESVASMPSADVVDWILVELRETPDNAGTATGSTMIARQAAFLLKDGRIASLDGISNPAFNLTITENLFTVIWSRNHLGIMSANPLPESGGVYSYNFTSGSGQAYGGLLAQKEVAPGIFGMIGGDANADGQVGNPDKVDVWVPQSGSAGYLNADWDMNGNVNNQDKVDVWTPNSGTGSQVPE
ncbi:MAG: choice-of-anchor D domain-containing protein [Bacteroidales bacterium]|nr:choice-of-anchor D domain-containing protein [Bacteroidales bacterium]